MQPIIPIKMRQWLKLIIAYSWAVVVFLGVFYTITFVMSFMSTFCDR